MQLVAYGAQDLSSPTKCVKCEIEFYLEDFDDDNDLHVHSV